MLLGHIGLWRTYILSILISEVNETAISTIENSSQTAARFFEAQFQQERASDSREPPACWTEATDSGVKGLEAMGDQAPARLRLNRGMRLRTKRDFEQIRNQGERLARGTLIVNWKVLPSGSPLRLGVITSRKIGPATIRSRARRLLREAVRLHQYDFEQPVALVLIARSSIVGKKLADVERDFLSVMRQARLLKTTSE